LSDPHERKYTLDYYLQLARELKPPAPCARHQGHGGAGAAARRLHAGQGLKEEVGLPVHFHTHDTSGIAAASVLAAIDAGADAVDGRSTP